MTTPSRLLTPEEIAAIRGRREGCPPGPYTAVNETHRSIQVAVPEPCGIVVIEQALPPLSEATAAVALLFESSIVDIPALLDHALALEGLLRDMAADEGAGLVLKMRRALEEIAALDKSAVLWSSRGEWAIGIAREALKP